MLFPGATLLKVVINLRPVCAIDASDGGQASSISWDLINQAIASPKNLMHIYHPFYFSTFKLLAAILFFVVLSSPKCLFYMQSATVLCPDILVRYCFFNFFLFKCVQH